MLLVAQKAIRMRIPRVGKGALPVILAMVLLTVFTPVVAQAADGTAQFNVSATSGRPGFPVTLTQGDPCPADPEGASSPQHVKGSFTDAAGVVTEFFLVTTVQPGGGNWQSEPGMRIPTTVAQGVGAIELQCVYWNAAEELVASQVYAPRAYTIMGGAPQFTSTPATVEPGGAVSLTSVDPCPTGRVSGMISGGPIVSNFDTLTDATGVWTLEALASSENMDGTRTPFAPGAYTIHAYCSDEPTARIVYEYATKPVVVGEPTPPVSNCGDVVFMAVAGSGQQFDGATNLSISPELKYAYRGFRQVLPDDKKVKIRVINYPALPVETLTRKLKLQEYMEGKNKGVNRLRSEVAEARLNCPDRPIVLAGYSQGALVVHEFMVEHDAATTGADEQAITAAILLGSPTRHASSEVVDFGDAPWDSQGICQFFAGGGCFRTMPFVDIPQAYRTRTTSVCLNFDIVCDTSNLVGVGAIVPREAYNEGVRVHTSYEGMPATKLAGKRAARQVMQRW